MTNIPDAPGAQSAESAPIDVQRVRRLFSRRERVAQSDFLRREIATRMHERLDLIRLQPQAVLDAGCAEGADLPLLQQRFAGARLFGLDAALPALQQAQQERQGQGWREKLRNIWGGGNQNLAHLLCADFARLPLAPASLDMIWSNLALHWHPQPDQVFAEWRRCLRQEGLLMFSCFGPNTFASVRQAFAAAGLREGRFLPFVDMHDLGDMLVGAGFATPVMDMEMVTVTYSDPKKMWADLQAFGGNPLRNRARGLIGRNVYARLLQALAATQAEKPDANDTNGKTKPVFRLEFEVIYGHAFKPVARQTASGEAIIRFAKPGPKSV